MIRIKLISDGTPPGTIITDADTGETIGRVRAFRIEMSVDKAPVLSVALERYDFSRAAAESVPTGWQTFEVFEVQIHNPRAP